VINHGRLVVHGSFMTEAHLVAGSLGLGYSYSWAKVMG